MEQSNNQGRIMGLSETIKKIKKISELLRSPHVADREIIQYMSAVTYTNLTLTTKLHV